MKPIDLTADPNFHAGRPVVRPQPSGSTLVLCPEGHLIASIRRVDWSGGTWEARAGDPKYTVACLGRRPS